MVIWQPYPGAAKAAEKVWWLFDPRAVHDVIPVPLIQSLAYGVFA